MTSSVNIQDKDDTAVEDKPLGLALSGGGYRATLFHLGVLWRLNELGLLEELKVVSSVSGGSIISGFLGLKWPELTFVNHKATNFKEIIADPTIAMCNVKLDVWAILKGLINPFKRPSDYTADAYEKYLVGDNTLQNLPSADDPNFLIYATNFKTGVSYRFTKDFIGDYKIGKIDNPDYKLSWAMSASSAFAPFLTPFIFTTKPSEWSSWGNIPLANDDNYKKRQVLGDGGIYDNMGVEVFFPKGKTPKYDVLISAAGAPLKENPKLSIWGRCMIALTLRSVDILTEQVRALRRRMIMRDYTRSANKVEGAYWNIASEIASYELADPIVSDSAVTKSLQNVATRLWPFDEDIQGYLINWGYVLADTAVRKWYRQQALGTWKWPIDKYPLP